MEEKRLRDTLIKRFIFVLIIVGIVEYVLLTMSDKFVMPFVARLVFPGYEMTESFSFIAISTYLLSAALNGLVNAVSSVIPGISRFSWAADLAAAILDKEDAFFISGSRRAIAEMTAANKLILVSMMLLVLIALALPYIAGAVYYSVSTVREFKKTEELRKENDAKEAKKQNLMISDIAHDLRTPITTISGYAQALIDGLVAEEEKEVYLAAILAKADSMSEIIQLLFDYTRLDSKGFSLKRTDTDLCEVLRQCAASLYTDAETAGMMLEADIPEKIITESIDRPHFTRVVTNLITNAIKHNGPGNTIGIFVIEDIGKTVIAIADKGDVIPAETASHLFEPFFMGDESRNSKGGSGLGLSVAKKICDMHRFNLTLKQGSILERYPVLKGYTKAFMIYVYNDRQTP